MSNKSEIFDKEDLEHSQDKLNKVAKDLGKQTKHFVKNKQKEFEELTDSYCEHVKEHPIRSVLLGFAAGVLFAKLFSNFGK